MSLIFKQISFKNFLSFGNKLTTIKLDKNEATLIFGENGMGKTTILESIYFSLFGKPFRSIKKSELINSINQKELYTELEFSYDNENYTIKRGMKPDIFEIYKNDTLINIDGAMKDYQTILNRMIGVDSKIFSDTIFISSKNYTPFLKLKASDKRNFIENVFGLKEFSFISDELKINRSLSLTKVSDLQKDIAHQVSLLEMGEETNEKTSSNNDILIKETDDKIKEEKTAGKKLSTEKKKIDKWLKGSDVENKLEIIEKKVEKTAEDISLYKSFISKNKNEIRRMKDEQEFFTNNTSCPQCKQPLDKKSEFLEKYLYELGLNISVQEGDLEFNLEDIGSLTQKKTSNIEEYNKLNKNYLKATQRLSDISNSINNHIRNIKSLEHTLMSLNDKNDSELIDVSLFKKKISNFKEELTEKDTRVDRIKTLIKMMGKDGIQKFVISKYLPMMNNLTCKWLGVFGANYRILFDSLFNVKIVARGYENLSYGSLSSGEEQRLNISLLFAFNELSRMKNSINTSILLLDEVGDTSLDETGLNGLFLAFEHFKENGISIFNISHRSELKDRFDNSIKVNKNSNNFSEIEIC